MDKQTRSDATASEKKTKGKKKKIVVGWWTNYPDTDRKENKDHNE